ncbi:IS1595 family transposase [Pasteurella multocida]|uniref:IS1595 family transposase n=1 Tax=Pasteurella multocida TaxID=747 RepID=UPI002CC9620A|nr:IS1595 family transposase [Pasteurella multocida]MEB3466405.1 IS1595 family transposase [Pasteurella multocida]
MPAKTKEIDVLKQLFETLSDKDKQQFLAEIVSSKSVIQKVIQPREITNCPHCQSSHIVKNGKRNGRQNFRCRSCNKAFVEQTGTILFSMKKDVAVMEKYVHCMIEKYSLRKCAEICDINLATAFAWRHKILDALQKMMNDVELDGIVQADETFTTISYKGHHKNFKLPRPSHKRGTKASKRGLSKEQVCIPVAVNLNGLSVAKVANLGRPNVADLQKVLGGKIAQDSVFVTDSLRSYQKLSFDMKLHHIQIPRNKFKSGVFNIQTVNNYHKRLKDLILGTFKGVSTKYLNNYLVYHNFVNFAKETKANKKVVLFDFIRSTFCQSRTCKISERPVLPILSNNI